MSDKILWRKATDADSKIIFDWNSDMEVRKAALSTEEILWPDHKNWFSKHKNRLWIAELEGEVVGQIRQDEMESETILSIVVAPNRRRKGLGSQMLREIVHSLDASKNRIVAYIRKDNPLSQKAFQSAGFIYEQDMFIKGVEVLKFGIKRTIGP